MLDPSRILFEDNHLIAVYKEPADLVQGDETGDETLVDKVKAYIKVKYNKPGDVFLGVIHRIDRPVSGVVVYARTSKALERMNLQFKEREVRKTYLAWVQGRTKTENGELVHFLLKNSATNKSKAYNSFKNGSKESKLTYEMIGVVNSNAVLLVFPQTGRHHQIRSQLSAIGNSIVGDIKYDYKFGPNEDKSICLHAYRVSFMHPVTNTHLEITAPVPQTDSWRPVYDFMRSNRRY